MSYLFRVDKMNKKNKKDLIYVGIIVVALLVISFLYSQNGFSTASIAYYNGGLLTPQFSITSPLIAQQIIKHPPQRLVLNNGALTFSISGVEPNNLSYVNDQISASFSVPIGNVTQTTSTTAVSTQCSPFVYDNTTGAIVAGGSSPVSVTSSPYTTSISYTPTTTGVYVFGAVCQTSSTTYSAVTNSWASWSNPKVYGQEQLYAINVVQPATPPPPPSFNLSQLLDSILSAITGFLKGLGL